MDFTLSKTQKLLTDSVREFTEREVTPRAGKMERSGALPDDLIHKMAHMGLLGMNLPERYGGSQATSLDCVLAIEQLSYSGTGAWWLAAFCNSIPESILLFGTDDQKACYLPLTCDGAGYPSLQFTEAETGSDPNRLTTRATLAGDGHYVVNGMKRFSTFGNRDGYAILFARDESDRCTAFLIDKKAPGYTCTANYPLMGSGGMEASDVYFENLKIDRQRILGEPGKGMSVLMHWIAYEKIQQCGACIGIAAAAVDEAIAHIKARAGGSARGHHQGVKWMLAEMHASLQACRWVTYHAAGMKDASEKNWIMEAAAAKIFVVPAVMEIVNKARRLHGAYGYTQDYKIERLYRAIAGASVIAVSLEINKSMVGGQLLKG